MESLTKRNLDLTSFSLKYSSKCALKSLECRGLPGASYMSKTTKQQQVGHLVFTDSSLE